jgi:hypothetical protein
LYIGADEFFSVNTITFSGGTDWAIVNKKVDIPPRIGGKSNETIKDFLFMPFS